MSTQAKSIRVRGWQLAPLLQMGQISSPMPITAHCTQPEAEGITYWAGSGGTLANKSLQWEKQGYFTGHSGIRFPALTYAAALCIFQVSGYGSSEVNIC